VNIQTNCMTFPRKEMTIQTIFVHFLEGRTNLLYSKHKQKNENFQKVSIMRRGRPNVRNRIKPMIVEIITNNRVPTSVNTIKKNIERGLGKEVSWNTVKKYLDELVTADVIHPTTLPHSKIEKKDGLTVYSIKR
jgi:hypothetical protein